jgi:hypothetical protein
VGEEERFERAAASHVEAVAEALSLAYPERLRLAAEMRGDMRAQFAALRAEGASFEAALERTLARFRLDDAARGELRAVHASAFARAWARLAPHRRRLVSDLLGAAALAGIVYVFVVEVPMVTFLTEGGPIVHVILALALGALAVLGRRGFRWFVRRDHSRASLAADDAGPLVVAALTFLVGVLGTAMGYYVVLSRWARHEIAGDELRIGLYEPLPCVIVATTLAAVIVVAHALMRQRLRALGVPSVAAPAP